MNHKKLVFVAAFLIGGLVVARCKIYRKRKTQITLTNGKLAHVASRNSQYRLDARLDKMIANAVVKSTQDHFSKGNPVARYDIKKKMTYWEYPDGRTEYATR